MWYIIGKLVLSPHAIPERVMCLGFKVYKNVNPFQARIIGSSLTAFNIANHIKKIRANASNNLFIKQYSESMVVIVDRVLRENNMLSTLQRSQPIGENQIRLDLENVLFNTLIQSLVQFSSSVQKIFKKV